MPCGLSDPWLYYTLSSLYTAFNWALNFVVFVICLLWAMFWFQNVKTETFYLLLGNYYLEMKIHLRTLMVRIFIFFCVPFTEAGMGHIVFLAKFSQLRKPDNTSHVEMPHPPVRAQPKNHGAFTMSKYIQSYAFVDFLMLQLTSVFDIQNTRLSW